MEKRLHIRIGKELHEQIKTKAKAEEKIDLDKLFEYYQRYEDQLFKYYQRYEEENRQTLKKLESKRYRKKGDVRNEKNERNN